MNFFKAKLKETDKIGEPSSVLILLHYLAGFPDLESKNQFFWEHSRLLNFPTNPRCHPRTHLPVAKQLARLKTQLRKVSRHNLTPSNTGYPRAPTANVQLVPGNPKTVPICVSYLGLKPLLALRTSEAAPPPFFSIGSSTM